MFHLFYPIILWTFPSGKGIIAGQAPAEAGKPQDTEEFLMDYRRFGDTLVIRMDKGEEIIQQLRLVADREKVKLAAVEALGAVDDFTVGVFDTDEKQYHSNTFTGAFEIVSLTGTVTTMDDKFYAHLHMSAGDDKGLVVGGHLNEAHVSATCEMVVTAIPGTVEREFNGDVGLNLFKF